METKDVMKALEAVESALDTHSKKAEADIKNIGKVASDTETAIKNIGLKQLELAEKLAEIEQKSTAQKDVDTAYMSWGEQFVKSANIDGLRSRKVGSASVEVKNTVTNVSGATSYPMNKPGIVPGVFVPLTVEDVLPSGTTDNIMVVGTRETSWTNNAAAVAQGAAKPESVSGFSQYNVPIETVAHFIKVSNQLLQDRSAVVAYINTRLAYGLNAVKDLQLLAGNGTSPNISGIQDTGNYTAFTPTVGANLVESINKAKYTMWAQGYVPDAVIVNPSDWGAMEIEREGAGSGAYLYGLPGMSAGTNPFGVRIVLSANQTVGKFTIGAFNRACMVWNRQGNTIEMGYVDDDFTKNLVTIRAECRLGLEVSIPGAILHGNITA
jgi:HK97 family phage major capsid protein